MTDYLAYWHIKGNAVPLQGQSLSCPFTHPFFEQRQKKSFEEVAFLLKKKITKIKEKTLKNQNAIFVLFWNKEINKYFKAHNN